MIVKIGDVVEWRRHYTSVVLDIHDGLIKIRPWCDRSIWVRPGAVRVIKKVEEL